MKVIIFGASGMVGQGVLREALQDKDVEKVLVVGRSSVKVTHPKLQEILLPSLYDLSSIRNLLKGYDACLYTLGVTSMGMSEEAYSKVTYDLTMIAAKAVIQDNPQMSFVFISAKSTDSTEKGPVMWARIKGKAENGILAMPFKHKHAVRPAFIQPMNGERSRVALYNTLYSALKFLVPVIKAILPNDTTTTVQLGRAMLEVAKNGYPKAILETPDINLVKVVS